MEIPEGYEKITCPKCGKTTAIKMGKSPDAVHVCKACEYKGTIGEFKQAQQVKASARRGGSKSPERISQANATTIFTAPSVHKAQETGVLKLCSSGETFALQEGVNIVGRKHPTSNATLQIPVTDSYMSRAHARIDKVRQGDSYSYRISDNNSKNQIQVNGQVLPSGDILLLSVGDKIVMGITEFMFE